MSHRQCTHAISAHRGWVTNQPEFFLRTAPEDKSRAFAGMTICDREQCIAAATHWVTAKTGEPGVWVTFADADARRGAA